MVKPTFSAASDEADPFPSDAPPVTAGETREEYLRRGRSGYTKVRNSLVQLPRTKDHGRSRPSTLALFGRNHRAAVLYLALLTNWTWMSRSERALRAETWIRFLTCDDPKSLTWTPQSLSHAWKVLEGFQLVTRVTKQRLRHITPLRENGSGDAYTRPDGSAGDAYFALPSEFWTAGLHGSLSWPALAVLLILLKETGREPVTELSVDRAEKFYGISRTTAEKGLAELRRRGLIDSKKRWVHDFDAAEGRRQTSLHAPLGPFSLEARRALQEAARKRQAGAAPGSKEASEDGEKESAPA